MGKKIVILFVLVDKVEWLEISYICDMFLNNMKWCYVIFNGILFFF